MTGPASYLTLEAGTPVDDRLRRRIGIVRRVLCHGDGLFDGIIVETAAGLRFVDAPEVRNIVGGTVVLGITQAEVERGDPRRQNAREVRRGGLRRLAGRAGARVPGARWGETRANDRDRRAVVDRLKRAYIEDRLDVERLGALVARAHEASTLRQLEQLLDEAGP